MIIIRNNDTTGPAHLQDGDRPQNLSSMADRGFALCGAKIDVRWYTWSPIPPTHPTVQEWAVCLDCVLAVL